MNNTDYILNLAKKNKGIITTKEVVDNNIKKTYLSRLVSCGKLERIKKGLYVLPSSWGDEYFNLVYKNNAIFCDETALYFLGLCESVPSTYHIAVKRGYNASLKKIEKVKLHYINPNLFELGIIEIKSPQGQIIKCYNAERCICDMLKNKNSHDIETIKYAITTYLKDKNKRNLPLLIEYSKKLKVEKEINAYLEVLI